MTSFWFCFPIPISAPPKRRPVLVVQRDELVNGLSQTVVAMISSNPARAGHPSRVVVRADSPEGHAAGLRLDSVIMTDNIATVLDSEIDGMLGHFPEMKAVDAALRHTLGL